MILLVSTLLHGEQLAVIALAVLLIIVLLVAGLSVWLVRRFRVSLGRRVFLLPPAVILLVVGSFYLLLWPNRPNSGPPQTRPASELRKLIEGLPDYAKFGYSGLGYFMDRLYITTNVGLVEVQNSEVSRFFRFQKKSSVVSGPWVDRVNQILWVMDDETHELLSYDGRNWNRFAMPSPQKGYYSRGEVLEGIQAVAGRGGLAFAAGGSVWRWDAQEHSWGLISSPPREMGEGRVTVLVGVLPLGKDVFIVRHELLSFLVKDDENFHSDTAVVWNGGWVEIRNPTGLRFFAEEWTSAGGIGYVCTRKGALLRVSLEEISPVDTPGECETLTTTEAGNLLASFRRQGIYELTTKWQRRADHPYPSGLGEYWVHLGAHGTEIAYAITAKPVVNRERSKGADYQWTENAPTRVWLIRDGQIRQLLSVSK